MTKQAWKPKYLSVIRWYDQHYTHGPMERSDLMYECIGNTTGFLIEEDSKQICISSEWFEWTDTLRHIIHIPKCAIISHKKIKI